MTIQDIISHRYSVREFYKTIPLCSITEANSDPLQLGDLSRLLNKVEIQSPYLSPKPIVDYGTALCYVCLKDLLSKFTRNKKPTDAEVVEMAEGMCATYYYWSVRDLPCFVNMVKRARVPSMKFGALEYELITLDVASIEGKMEAYDRMRPNPQALQGGSPEKATEKELTDWHKTHLMDGTPYDWTDMNSCKGYWHDPIDMCSLSERTFREKVGTKQSGCIETVDAALSKIRKNAQEPNV